MHQTTKLISVVLTGAVALISGCGGIGPETVARDRFDYTVAISDSWKNQMLLNLVKVRYGDAPIFLDVGSVINQYELHTQANVAASWQSPLASNANTLGIGGSGSYTDRPTITYTPITGEKFARSLMTPISPAAVLSLVQSGYPIDMVFRFAIQSINGIQNRFYGLERANAADPEFYTLLGQLRKIQNAGAIGMRIRKLRDKEAVVMSLTSRANQATGEENREVRKMLGLDPREAEFELVYDSISRSDKEIAILTRSMLQILIDLASSIEVPESHVVAKRVTPTLKEEMADGAAVPPLIRVYSSAQRPAEAFVTVRYGDHWYFIDDRDMPSKGVFSFLMFAFTLTETGSSREGTPIVTIPTR